MTVLQYHLNGSVPLKSDVKCELLRWAERTSALEGHLEARTKL